MESSSSIIFFMPVCLISQYGWPTLFWAAYGSLFALDYSIYSCVLCALLSPWCSFEMSPLVLQWCRCAFTMLIHLSFCSKSVWCTSPVIYIVSRLRTYHYYSRTLIYSWLETYYDCSFLCKVLLTSLHCRFIHSQSRANHFFFIFSAFGLLGDLE